MARSELAKQRERINKTIRQAIKRGYIFPYRDVKGKGFSQVFGSTVAELSKIKSADIYSKLRYFDPVSDKFISGTERRKAERRASYERGQETKRLRERNRQLLEGLSREDEPTNIVDKTLVEIENKISNWQRESKWVRVGKNGKFTDFGDLKEQDKDRLSRMLSGMIAREGRYLVALRAERNATKINKLVDYILYGGSGDKLDSSVESTTNTYMQAELQKVMEILNGGVLSQEDSEYLTTLSEAQLPYGENS